jgi:hypothetical protein
MSDEIGQKYLSETVDSVEAQRPPLSIPPWGLRIITKQEWRELNHVDDIEYELEHEIG